MSNVNGGLRLGGVSSVVGLVATLRAAIARGDVWAWFGSNDDGSSTDPIADDGSFMTDGTAAVRFEASIGEGRGSAKVNIGAADLVEISEYLKSWDPNADVESGRPIDVVKSTIAAEGDYITFKVSNAKNSRSIKVPVGEWPAFKRLLSETAEAVPKIVEAFRSLPEISEQRSQELRNRRRSE